MHHSLFKPLFLAHAHLSFLTYAFILLCFFFVQVVQVKEQKKIKLKDT